MYYRKGKNVTIGSFMHIYFYHDLEIYTVSKYQAHQHLIYTENVYKCAFISNQNQPPLTPIQIKSLFMPPLKTKH